LEMAQKKKGKSASCPVLKTMPRVTAVAGSALEILEETHKEQVGKEYIHMNGQADYKQWNHDCMPKNKDNKIVIPQNSYDPYSTADKERARTRQIMGEKLLDLSTSHSKRNK
jgi:hypothetical protein